MAATYAGCVGYDKTGRVKEAHRLGGAAADGFAKTFRTIAEAYIRADGSGWVHVSNMQTGESIHRFDFGPESEREPGRKEQDELEKCD